LISTFAGHSAQKLAKPGFTPNCEKEVPASAPDGKNPHDDLVARK
jgi:hypothetical protein